MSSFFRGWGPIELMEWCGHGGAGDLQMKVS